MERGTINLGELEMIGLGAIIQTRVQVKQRISQATTELEQIERQAERVLAGRLPEGVGVGNLIQDPNTGAISWLLPSKPPALLLIPPLEAPSGPQAPPEAQKA